MELSAVDALILGQSLALTITLAQEEDFASRLKEGLEDAIAIRDEDPLEPFRAEYERLTGKRADRRWSEDRLFSEIEKADA